MTRLPWWLDPEDDRVSAVLFVAIVLFILMLPIWAPA